VDGYWEAPKAGVEHAIKSVQHFGVAVEMYLFDLYHAESFVRKAKEILKDEPDAILFSPLFSKESKWLLEEAEKRNIPNVMINTNIENENSLCYIGPDAYQSGVLAARLLNFGLQKGDTVAILNLSKVRKNARHLIDKANGFTDYFNGGRNTDLEIVQYDFADFEEENAMRVFMDKLFRRHQRLAGIFVTNSRSFRVAKALSSEQAKRVKIVGFDIIAANLKYLRDNRIDFLINQNSVQQGYQGIMSLFNHFILKKEVRRIQHLPLDIVVLENYKYHLEEEKRFRMAFG